MVHQLLAEPDRKVKAALNAGDAALLLNQLEPFIGCVDGCLHRKAIVAGLFSLAALIAPNHLLG